MDRESSSSVEIISVDLPGIQRALERYIADLRKYPEVVKVVVFGSMATGRYAPGSDLDVLVVISHSNKSFLARIPVYIPAQCPVDVDVFPYTEDEMKRLTFPQEALHLGKVVWERGMDKPTDLFGDARF